MTSLPDATPADPKRRVPQLLIGLSVFLYAYLLLRVDPGLTYYWTRSRGPVFSWGWDFGRGFLGYPGGPVRYVASGLFQLYRFSWLGALIPTLVAVGVYVLTGRFLHAVSGRRFVMLPLVPVFLLVILQGRYVHVLPAGLALLSGLAAACLYVRLRGLSPPQRLGAFAAIAVAAHYAAGGGLLLYVFLCAVYELSVRRQWGLGLGILAAGAALPMFSARIVFNLRPRDAYVRFLPFHLDALPGMHVPLACLYGFLVLAVGLAGLFRVLPAWPPGRAGRLLRMPAVRLAAAAVVLAAGLAATWTAFDSQLNAFLVMERASRRGEWEEVLRAARRVKWGADCTLAGLQLNRALYHTGRLGDEMFSYPQHGANLLTSPVELSGGVMMTLSDILFDLGRVNASEHMAQEALSGAGNRPWILERLALTQLAKGETEAARVFLNVLCRDVMEGGRGRALLEAAAADPLASSDDRVRRLRALMPERDDPFDRPLDTVSLQQLERNRRNRMAFEYLMAHYLLTRRLDGLAANMYRLADLGYTRVPRHYEEALLLHASQQPGGIDLRRMRISPSTISRFRGFMTVLRANRASRAAAWNALRHDYGDTYFFYYQFAPRGGERQGVP